MFLINTKRKSLVEGDSTMINTKAYELCILSSRKHFQHCVNGFYTIQCSFSLSKSSNLASMSKGSTSLKIVLF